MEMNPYAPPQAPLTPPPLGLAGEDEEIRKKHLNTEATIKSVGTLYYLGFFALAAGAFTAFTGLTVKDTNPIVMGAIFLVLSLVQLFLAYGLRRLLPWSRWPTVVFSCVGLLAFPIGTLINGLILSNLLGAKGKMVFSEDYKRIISVTPHIKYKSSIWVIVLAILLIILLIGIIAAVSIGE
jgi:hypothetical protein